jgi:cytochrome c-type biogenesis protein CcmH/NrfF
LYYATITVKAEPLAKPSNLVEQNWRWLLPVGLVLTVAAAALLVGMLRKREQRRPSEPRDEGGV